MNSTARIESAGRTGEAPGAGPGFVPRDGQRTLRIDRELRMIGLSFGGNPLARGECLPVPGHRVKERLYWSAALSDHGRPYHVNAALLVDHHRRPIVRTSLYLPAVL